MSNGHARFIVVDHGVGGAVVNFVLNGAIAWLLFRHLDIVPLWGQQSIAGDTIGTTFFLPFLTCLIVTPLARHQAEASHLGRLDWTLSSHPLLRWLPSGTVRRGLVLGLVCAAVVAPPALSLLSVLGITDLTFWHFVTFKASFAAVLALVVQPFIVLCALARSPDAP